MTSEWVVTFALLTTLVTAVTLASGQRVTITPHGNQMTNTDNDVTLTCSLAENRPPANKKTGVRLTWYGPDSREITTTQGRVFVVRIDRTSLRLHLTRIEENDAGKYRCHATDPSAGLSLSAETRLLVYEDIRFTETPTLERHLLGNDAFLQCRATGLPRPEIVWYFNNRKISPDGSKYTLESNGLRINQLDLRDSGMYECRAEVEMTGNSKSRSVSLDILYPPVILRQPTADGVIKGHSLTLHCRADGNPQVMYEWLREQKMSDVISAKVSLNKMSETYSIARVNSEHEGRYYCRVSNAYGMKEVHVDVKMMIPPIIKPLPSKAAVPEGQTLNVTCEASGIPVPLITWNRSSNNGDDLAKDKQYLIRSGRWVETVQPGINTLLIRGVDRSLRGLLRCTASNLAGSDTQILPLHVEYKPTLSLDQSEQYGWSGQTRSLRCIADGVPPPTVTWLREEHYTIQNSSVFQIVNSHTTAVISTLTVNIPASIGQVVTSMYGAYQCVAKNVHGFDKQTARLIEAVTPEMVRNVSVLEETPTTVSLRAIPPSTSTSPHLPLLTWMVKYELSTNAVEQHTRTFNFSSDTLTVTDLHPGTTYTFYLSISNAVGYSNPLKFRVTTPRRLNFNQQSDVPDRTEDDNWESTGTNSGSDDSNFYLDESKTEILMDKSFMSNRDMIIILIATAIGSVIVILSIIVAVVCVSTRRKKIIHRHSCSDPPPEPPLDSRPLPAEPIDNRIMLPPIWQPTEDALPDILRNDYTPPSTSSRVATPKDRVKLTQNIRQEPSRQLHPMCRSGSLTYGSIPGSVPASRKPTARTLQHQQRSFDESSHGRRRVQTTDDCFDLPPPPAFLLYPNPDEDHRSPAVLRRQGFSHGDLLDGYHSGDNVDDDIDQIDYTIRVPSVHSQMFKYSS